MKTVSIAVDEGIWEAAQQAAAEARTDLNSLLRDYLGRLASGAPPPSEPLEAASRKRLVDLLKQCRITLDGRPTRESCYTGHRFH
jgi:hypothetical protein